MTWYYDISQDRSSMDVYDHTGSLVETVQNDGGGFKPKPDVLAVMEADVRGSGFDSLTRRQKIIMLEAIFENIEQGTPQ